MNDTIKNKLGTSLSHFIVGLNKNEEELTEAGALRFI